ncbi:PssE/Cps14G family polysaccharide biosynthesis glycosyltransferase [Thermococcus zilligii]|uniref:PssE/Cps14G family polysaccharide biosynthesis glycosyltransferase n=1 Tax=Thermococcus zilligii TaxID=54076 RepID=UPI00029AC192|nr:PssE/Cps14G family polysaccharide biosynthesis glycosyltransferase [Thermococcus zilligii]
MIFVTVGNSNLGFERLIKAMDNLAQALPYPVVMQIGATNYVPKNVEWFRYCDHDTIIEHFKKSRVIVTHAGAGTIFDILLLGKKPVVIPRLSKFKEHIDDHQVEITRALENQKLIIPVYDIHHLGPAILKALEDNYKVRPTTNTPSRLIRILSEILNSMGGDGQ